MAIVKGSVIGFLSGMLGYLSAKIVKGRTMLAAIGRLPRFGIRKVSDRFSSRDISQ